MSALVRSRLVLMLALTVSASMDLTTSPAQAAGVTVGRFPSLSAVESVLKRGTPRDAVRDALGDPVGSGHGRIPPDHRPLEIWYYEDIEVEDAVPVGEYVHMQMRQRILLVFFDGDTVEGFLWTSNTGDAEAKTK